MCFSVKKYYSNEFIKGFFLRLSKSICFEVTDRAENKKHYSNNNFITKLEDKLRYDGRMIIKSSPQKSSSLGKVVIKNDFC